MVGSLDDRCGQCLAVHLLVLVERNGINLHRGSRNHVRRFLLADECIQFLDIYLLVADDVSRDELTARLVVESLDSSVLNAWELADNGLDFLQLDAEAADLHLTVLTSNELDIAIGEIAHDIACAIHTGIFCLIREGVLQIGLGCLFRTVEVAAAHLRTADP